MPDVLIQGRTGRLEGRYHHSTQPGSPVALILHPHPLHGGTMNNKVVYTLYQTFQKQSFSTLRFNFRGVGRSQGHYGGGDGELADAISALEWLQTFNPNAQQTWIAGFSFGSWVALQLLMRRPETTRFVVAAPPANMFDFSFLAPCPCSGLVLQGDHDSIVPKESVDQMVAKVRMQKGMQIDSRTIKGADHFFKDHLDVLEGHVEQYLQTTLQAGKTTIAAKKAA